MTARQNIVRVRSDQTALSSEVASLVPSEIGRARKRVQMMRSPKVRTTFCPLCGGNKGLTARRCGECRDRANAEHWAKGGIGWKGASRSLLDVAVTREHPSDGTQTGEDQPTTWSRRVRGEGQQHQQPWDRKILVDGVWVAESQTREGKERKRLDDEAVRRLTR